MSEKEIKDLNEKTDDLFMDIRIKKLKGIDTTDLEKQAQSNIDKSRRMREYLEKQQKTNIDEAKTIADQSLEVTKRLNKLSNKKYPTEAQPEPQPDINTYKCVALKEITNYLWSNKNKGELVNVVIDLLYSISKSEDTGEIQKLVEMYRRQTGQGKKKKKSSKTKKKKGGKRSSKKRTSKKRSSKKKRSKK